MAPGQAESEVLGGSKEGAKVVVGEFGYFLAGDNEEANDIMKNSLSAISGPEPGVSVSVAVNEAGKQILSPHPGPGSGMPVPDVVHWDVQAW